MSGRRARVYFVCVVRCVVFLFTGHPGGNMHVCYFSWWVLTIGRDHDVLVNACALC